MRDDILPVQIDHDERRSELSNIAANLIGRDGLRAVTIRNVAAAAGFSTKVVTHYFADKSELLFRVYHDAAMRADARVNAAYANDPTDLVSAMEANLPLTKDALRDWKIFIASWDAAFSEGIFLERQRFWMRHARNELRRVLVSRREAGLKAHTDPQEAPRLLMIVTGIATQAVFGEQLWSPSNQRRALAAELDRA